MYQAMGLQRTKFVGAPCMANDEGIVMPPDIGQTYYSVPGPDGRWLHSMSSSIIRSDWAFAGSLILGMSPNFVAGEFLARVSVITISAAGGVVVNPVRTLFIDSSRDVFPVVIPNVVFHGLSLEVVDISGGDGQVNSAYKFDGWKLNCV